MRKARGPIPGAPKPEPWKPADYEIADAAAIQAVAHGRASEDQQRRAFHFIVHAICGNYDLPYRPASARDTDFALGKMFVGQQLVKFVNLNLAVLRGKDTEQGQPRQEREQST